MARQRAISVRRRSPPDNWLPLFFLTFCKRNSAIRLSSLSFCNSKGLVGHFQYRCNIVFHTHLTEHGSLLRQITDTRLRTLVYRIFRYIQIIQEDTSLIGSNQPYGHIKRSCPYRRHSAPANRQSPLASHQWTHGSLPYASVLFHQILRTQHHATFLPCLCPSSQLGPALQIFLNFLYIVLYAFFFFHTLKVFAANVAKISRNSVHLHSNTYMLCLKHLRQWDDISY